MLPQILDYSHFLLIDTATDLPIVAYRKWNVWECVLLQRGPELSKTLLRQVSGWNIQKESEKNNSLQIVLGIGPGSYAGIRAGTTIAQALGFAWEVPVHRISSLDWLLPAREGEFIACIDAKAGGIYAQKRIFLEGKNLPRGDVLHYTHADALLCEIEEGTALVAPVPLGGCERWEKIALDKKISFYHSFEPVQGVFTLFHI